MLLLDNRLLLVGARLVAVVVFWGCDWSLLLFIVVGGCLLFVAVRCWLVLLGVCCWLLLAGVGFGRVSIVLV